MAMMLDEPTEGFTMPSGRQGPTAPAFPSPQHLPSSSSRPPRSLFVNGDFSVPSQSRAAVSQLTGSFPNSAPMPRPTMRAHTHRRNQHRRDMSQDTAGPSSGLSISPPFSASSMYPPTHTQQAQHTQSRQLSLSSHYPPFLGTINDANQYSPPTNTSLTFPTPITMPAPQLPTFPSVPSHSNMSMNHPGQQQPPSSSHHLFQQQQQR